MPFWYFGSEGTERGMYEYFGRNELGQNKVQEFKVIFSAQGTLDTFFCDQKLHPPYNIPKHSYFTWSTEVMPSTNQPKGHFLQCSFWRKVFFEQLFWTLVYCVPRKNDSSHITALARIGTANTRTVLELLRIRILQATSNFSTKRKAWCWKMNGSHSLAKFKREVVCMTQAVLHRWKPHNTVKFLMKSNPLFRTQLLF